MKKIIITGATGSIGRILAQQLIARGDEVIVFTRDPKSAAEKIPKGVGVVKWEYESLDAWMHELHGVDTVVHLASANLSSKRWNEKFKKEAYDSRIASTRNLVEAIRNAEQKPKVFICSSAVGYYGERFDEILDEESSPGNDFLADLCKDWENEASKVEQYGVRRVSLRTSPTLIKHEGALKKMLWPYKLFIGGPLSKGKQWFPWIHIDDIVGIYLRAIDNEKVSGAINGASPGIVTMKEFAKTLGNVLNRPSAFPVPKSIMKIAAGEVAEFAVMSQRTSVDKILNAGYKFKFENLEEAMKDLLQ